MTLPALLPNLTGMARPPVAPAPGWPSGPGAVDALLQHRRAILWGALLGLLGAAAALWLIPPHWQAAADIELAPVRQPNDSPREDLAANLSDALVENQGVMALSRPVLARAAQVLPPSVLPPGNPDVIMALQQQLTVRRLPRTMVWRITASARSPEAAAQVANSVASAWVEEHHQLQADAAARQAARINSYLPALEQNLRTSERAAAMWRRQHALVADGDANGASLADRQLANLNERLAEARSATISAQARLESFTASTPGDNDDGATPAILKLRQNMTELARRDAELATRYGPQYPERAAMRAQIGATARAITAERERQLRTLQAAADMAAAREKALRQSLDSTQTGDTAPQGAASENAIRLRELERQAAADRAAYETALGRLRTAQSQQHFAGPAARIMSPAVANARQRNYTPGLALALAGAAGGILGFAAASLRNRLRDPCLSAQQVADDLGVSRVAEAPLLGRDLRKARGHIMQPATVVAMRPLSRFAEGFRAVRASLDASPRAHQDQMSPVLTLPEAPRGVSVLVTSGQPGDGKTTTAIGLALSMAESGRRVVLVDADLRRAGLSDFFDLRTHIGFAELLRDQASFASASVRKANLVIIPAGMIAGTGASPLSLLGSPVQSLLRRLAITFDHVIVDGPPMDVTEDAAVLVQAVDTAVLALRWGHTPRYRARHMAARLTAEGKLGAVMLTRINLARTPRYGPHAAYSSAALRAYFRG